MARRRKGRAVNGVLLFDKPGQLSSNHALQQVRRLFEAQKAGHTGTLDPMATGLLPICLGEATKFSAHLLDADKVYRARVQLGVTTDTGDAEGQVLCEQAVPVLTRLGLDAVLEAFRGEIEQVPPMYSALKHQGRKLYELAREGKQVERAARPVTVYDARLLTLGENSFDLEVSCSKGTYIRTLAEDIGAALGCGAHLTGLRRLASGGFGSEAMVTLDSLEASSTPGGRDAWLLPVDSLVAHLPALEVSAEALAHLQHGQSAAVASGLDIGSLARIYHASSFAGLCEVKGTTEVAPKRLLSTASAASSLSR